MAQPLLTVKEASAYLKVHPNTIYRWTLQNKIPFVRVNGLTRLNQQELNKQLIQESNNEPAFLFPLPYSVQLLASHARIGLKGEGALGKKSSRRLNLNWGAVYVRKTKQGRERWCLDYRDARGKRIQKVVRNALNRQDAVIALQAAVQGVFNAQHNIKPALLPVFYGELAAQYLERYAQTNKRSWKTDRSYLKSMTDYFGNVMLSEITSLQVEGYKAERLKQGVKPSTVNRCLAILRKMFNLAVEWGYIQDQQKPKFRLFSEKDTQKERTLTQDEEVRLFQASADHLKPILKVALHTGMRLGEILGLSWEQVDLRKAQIRVEKTKSGKIRFIPINSTLQQELKALGANSRYLFCSREAGKDKPLTTVRTAFKAACRRAGIKGLRFHDLRHTFASRLIERGADIITVKELLGHSSVKITERYTHSQDGQKRFAASLLNSSSCAKPSEAENLLRICDAESRKKSRKTESPFFSVN